MPKIDQENEKIHSIKIDFSSSFFSFVSTILSSEPSLLSSGVLHIFHSRNSSKSSNYSKQGITMENKHFNEFEYEDEVEGDDEENYPFENLLNSPSSWITKIKSILSDQNTLHFPEKILDLNIELIITGRKSKRDVYQSNGRKKESIRLPINDGLREKTKKKNNTISFDIKHAAKIPLAIKRLFYRAKKKSYSAGSQDILEEIPSDNEGEGQTRNLLSGDRAVDKEVFMDDVNWYWYFSQNDHYMDESISTSESIIDYLQNNFCHQDDSILQENSSEPTERKDNENENDDQPHKDVLKSAVPLENKEKEFGREDDANSEQERDVWQKWIWISKPVPQNSIQNQIIPYDTSHDDETTFGFYICEKQQRNECSHEEIEAIGTKGMHNDSISLSPQDSTIDDIVFLDRNVDANSAGLHQRIISTITIQKNATADKFQDHLSNNLLPTSKSKRETYPLLYFQFLPEGFYVDVDELNSWLRRGEFDVQCSCSNCKCHIQKIFAPPFIDIEKPKFLSKQNIVGFLFDYDNEDSASAFQRKDEEATETTRSVSKEKGKNGRMKRIKNVSEENPKLKNLLQIKFTYPIHLRYPLPANSSVKSHERQILPPPIILKDLSNSNNNDSDDKNNIDRGNEEGEENIGLKEIFDIIDQKIYTSFIQKVKVPTSEEVLDKNLYFEVPCGEKRLAGSILSTTVTLGLIGTFLLLQSLYNVSKRMKKKKK